METRRVSEPAKQGSIAMGTIGFDMYLAALSCDRSALRPQPTPRVAA